MASSRHVGHAGPCLSGRCASARHQGERTSTSRQTCCPLRFPRCAGSSGVSSGQGRPIPVASSLGRTGDADTSSAPDDHTGPAEPELINPGCSTRARSAHKGRENFEFPEAGGSHSKLLRRARYAPRLLTSPKLSAAAEGVVPRAPEFPEYPRPTSYLAKRGVQVEPKPPIEEPYVKADVIGAVCVGVAVHGAAEFPFAWRTRVDETVMVVRPAGRLVLPWCERARC